MGGVCKGFTPNIHLEGVKMHVFGFEKAGAYAPALGFYRGNAVRISSM